jgi:hypothetical protein
MMRRGALALAVLALSGCGSGSKPPAAAKPPHIPRALAHTWATQADAVAQALADHDGCTALAHANELRDAVTSSENRVPIRLRATLTSAVDALPGRITCNPAPPPKQEDHHPPKPPKPPDHHDHGHGHH